MLVCLMNYELLCYILDMFGDISSLETFGVVARKPKPKPVPEPSPSDDEAEESHDHYQSDDNEVSDDGMDMEKELQELLAPPAPKRYMRMYADDVEDKIREKKYAFVHSYCFLCSF